MLVGGQRRPRAAATAALLVVTAAVLAGCGGGSGGGESSTSTTGARAGATGERGEAVSSGSAEPTGATGKKDKKAGRHATGEVVPPPSKNVEQAEMVDVYFTSGEQFEPVQRELPKGADPLTYAATAVLAGPTKRERERGAEAQTLIPAGVAVEDVALSKAGTAKVQLSPGFTVGIPADPDQRTKPQQRELNARLAQLTYTLTAFKQVKATEVSSGGVPVTAGQTRKDYAKPKGGPPDNSRPRGSRAPGVRGVQRRLAKLEYLPKKAVDGIQGYRTQQAVIAFQSWEGLDRDGVVGPQTSAALAAARRPRPGKSGPARRIEVYNAKGVALLVRGGRVKRAIHVSTGKPGYETPPGSYSVFRKELNSWSVPYHTWLPYASYFFQGIAFHEYAEVPAYPASHGCVRVPEPEAKFVYRYAAVGTPVIVR